MRGLKPVSARRSDALARVGWQQLESLLGDYYRSQGYQVEHCGTGGTGARFDGGVDLRLRRDSEFLLVQAKHWTALKVPHNAVHELLGLMVNEGATGSILVTSGEFTKAAVEAAARQGHVQLVDGEDLRTMLGQWTRAHADAMSHAVDARWKRGAVDVSRDVGQRLLGAAEDGLRNGAYSPRPRRAASAALTAVVVKFALAIVLMLMLLFGGMYAIQGIFSHMSTRTAASRPARAVVPSAAPESRLRPVEYQPSEINAGPAPGPSAAELREQKRRADEAIKVIEANTPEM